MKRGPDAEYKRGQACPKDCYGCAIVRRRSPGRWPVRGCVTKDRHGERCDNKAIFAKSADSTRGSVKFGTWTISTSKKREAEG
jgi:hypothetical protein